MASPDSIEAAAAALGVLGVRDVPLGPFCTYRVGGDAALLVEASSVADLEIVADAVVQSNCETLVVGKGSNLLVSDSGFPGIVVCLGETFAETEIDAESGVVRAGASAFLPRVARTTAAASLSGFEWAVGVPGSIGGAVRMNAGGHGSDMAASLDRASIFDLSLGTLADWTLDDLKLGYRCSSLKQSHLVLSADLHLEPGDRAVSEAEISNIVRWRRENQPGGQNAGSVFANPPGDSAGRIIDSLGLKGLRSGSAAISDKHANFIQADPDGSADDIYRLIREIQLRVATATGIELKPENRLIGFQALGELDDN